MSDANDHPWGPDYDSDEEQTPRGYGYVSVIAVVFALMAFLIGAISTGPLTDKVNSLKAELANQKAYTELSERMLYGKINQHFDYFVGKEAQLWADVARLHIEVEKLKHKKRVVIENYHYTFEKMADTYTVQKLKPLTPYDNPQSH